MRLYIKTIGSFITSQQDLCTCRRMSRAMQLRLFKVSSFITSYLNSEFKIYCFLFQMFYFLVEVFSRFPSTVKVNTGTYQLCPRGNEAQVIASLSQKPTSPSHGGPCSWLKRIWRPSIGCITVKRSVSSRRKCLHGECGLITRSPLNWRLIWEIGCIHTLGTFKVFLENYYNDANVI